MSIRTICFLLVFLLSFSIVEADYKEYYDLVETVVVHNSTSINLYNITVPYNYTYYNTTLNQTVVQQRRNVTWVTDNKTVIRTEVYIKGMDYENKIQEISPHEKIIITDTYPKPNESAVDVYDQYRENMNKNWTIAGGLIVTPEQTYFAVSIVGLMLLIIMMVVEIAIRRKKKENLKKIKRDAFLSKLKDYNESFIPIDNSDKKPEQIAQELFNIGFDESFVEEVYRQLIHDKIKEIEQQREGKI